MGKIWKEMLLADTRDTVRLRCFLGPVVSAEQGGPRDLVLASGCYSPLDKSVWLTVLNFPKNAKNTGKHVPKKYKSFNWKCFLREESNHFNVGAQEACLGWGFWRQSCQARTQSNFLLSFLCRCLWRSDGDITVREPPGWKTQPAALWKHRLSGLHIWKCAAWQIQRWDNGELLLP